MRSFDVIGDIHGQADKLCRLLAKMGYTKDETGTWRHQDRTAIFVGDLIDRGPKQVLTVELVRQMVESGSALAVLGNHEFNAIAWYLPDPEKEGEYLRPRSGGRGIKNREQHEAFLSEVERKPDKHKELIEWFLTLPLWLELPEIRVVHACWHPGHIKDLKKRLAPGNTLTPDFVAAASRKGRYEYIAVEALTKGLEVPLPDGHSFVDKDGHTRTEVRTKWWDANACSYREAALMPKDQRAALPDLPVPKEFVLGTHGSTPLFFGHYWAEGLPTPVSPNAACVDYSAGKGGPLVAYRWDGEQELHCAKFVTSDHPPGTYRSAGM